tara:strand:- start:1253 stop:1468 length:216 start_codon:yes stop_codon:yes gene_type:complete
MINAFGKTFAYRIEFNPTSGVTAVGWDRKTMGAPNKLNLQKAVKVMSAAWGVEFKYAKLVRQSCGTEIAAY